MLTTCIYRGDKVSRFLNLYRKDVGIPFQNPEEGQLGVEQTRWLGLRNFYNQSPIHTHIRWSSPDPPSGISKEEQLGHYLLLIVYRPTSPSARVLFIQRRRRCLLKIATLRMGLSPPRIIFTFDQFHLGRLSSCYWNDLNNSLQHMLTKNYSIARLTKHPAMPLIYNNRGEEFITLYVSKYGYMFNLQRLFVTAKVLGLYTPQTLNCYRHLIKHVAMMRGPQYEEFLELHVRGFLNFLYDYLTAKPLHPHKSTFYTNNLLDILEFIEMPAEQWDGDIIIVYKHLHLYRTVWKEALNQMSRAFSTLEEENQKILLKLAVHVTAQYLLVYPDRQQELATILANSNLPKQVVGEKTMLYIALKNKTCRYDDTPVYYSEQLIELLRSVSWLPDTLLPVYSAQCMKRRTSLIHRMLRRHATPYIKTLTHVPGRYRPL